MTPSKASAEMKRLCTLAPVIPVLVIEDAATARPLAEALVAGGLPVLEVTLRTPAALAAIAAMRAVKGAIVGAGTLVSQNDVRKAHEAGASFGVSPGATDDLLQAATAMGMPLLPGAATASEAMSLLARGYDMLKFFPAEGAGGTAALKSLAGPLPQISFCPTGGITPDNAAAYLALPNVACVGGSWVAPRDPVRRGDWDAIRSLARQAAAMESRT
ncbi:MAG: bifunctional 4-hydroxy-2-oxoglutarate aldolase/2-dehydro-3-deoxy-phosphogluconate aldolase [Paracoccaceae bacterium]|nr:bifunctional 4-hydroxy-2-oxoglutarate aldolase/2-dehydro-3-deoxy-phosphogluconate aldolase [Paracoccaceae bacterium]